MQLCYVVIAVREVVRIFSSQGAASLLLVCIVEEALGVHLKQSDYCIQSSQHVVLMQG